LKKIFVLGTSVLCTFFITFLVFPGLVILIPSTQENLNVTSWFSEILISLFHLTNFLGSFLPGNWEFFSRPFSPDGSWLWIPVVIRMVFPVFLLLCYYPRIFASDIVAYILVSGLGLSNGYLGSLLMSFAPMRVDPLDQEYASELMTIFLNTGLVMGSTIAFFSSLI